MRRWHWSDPPEPLAAHLQAGGVVFIPSESSYGVAVDPRNVRGVERVYDLKRRQGSKALPVVAPSVAALAQVGIDASSEPLRVLARVWPAPLTAVLPTGRAVPAAAGLGTLAVRVPQHQRLRHLMEGLGLVLTATSANLAGQAPVLDPGDLEVAFPEADAMVVDDGRLPGGPPSTVVEWLDPGWRVLRPGSLSREDLAGALGEVG